MILLLVLVVILGWLIGQYQQKRPIKLELVSNVPGLQVKLVETDKLGLAIEELGYKNIRWDLVSKPQSKVKARHWLRNDNPAQRYAPAKAATFRVSINNSKAGQKICV